MLMERFESLEHGVKVLCAAGPVDLDQARRERLAIFLSCSRLPYAELQAFFSQASVRIFVAYPTKFYYSNRNEMLRVDVEGDRANMKPLTNEQESAARAIIKDSHKYTYRFSRGVGVTAAAEDFNFKECCDATTPQLEYFEALICCVNTYLAKLREAVPGLEIRCVRVSKPYLDTGHGVDRPFPALYDGGSGSETDEFDSDEFDSDEEA